AVSGHPLHCGPQSLVIPCTVSAVSGHSLLLCPQSLVISCTVSAVSGHLMYCVRSLWSSHCTVFFCSPLVQNIFFSCFSPLKPRCVLWSGASYGAKKYGI
ncbi:unnamed protein product, partial [Staurois parvus]